MAELLEEITFIFSRLDWLSVLDILLVALVIYSLLALVRGTQAVVLLRGIILVVLMVVLLSSILQLRAFTWLLRNTLPALLLSIPVIFAPELRRALERLGRAGTGLTLGAREAEIEPVIEAIKDAAVRLSERRHGALIVIERQVGLKNYADTGVALDAAVTVELLMQVFYPNTPLHDGAVIIKGARVVAAACIMPLTSGETTDKQMGLRHRAALGITEVSDAVAVVISEETGAISVAHNGRMIQRLDAPRLRHILAAFYRPRGGGNNLVNWLRRPFGRPPQDGDGPRPMGE
ncbi:MAG: TIGR00159 family protein [Anaerolineales bacterium]|nr:TIGR00159 family protein [Anaerolineales bacterium]